MYGHVTGTVAGAKASPILTLLLMWFVGVNLRTVILGVPPTLPTLHQALGLSYSATGLLSSLPVLLMAIGAIPGAFLISRVGPRAAVSIGLGLVAVGAALRGAIPAAAALFAFTVVLGLGVAFTQPALPGLTQAWFPRNIGRAVAIYSNGLLIGEVVAASITLPFLLAPFGWQVGLAAWALPAALVLVLWLAFAPPAGRDRSTPISWVPDWRSGSMLRIGLLMGSASLIYYGTNTWVPDTLDARHAHALIAPSLATLNGMQLAGSALLAIFGRRVLGRRWPYLLAATGSLVGLGGYILTPPWLAPYWAGIIGAMSALAFILTLGLPALLDPAEVARTSGFMFAIGYGTAFVGPALGGIIWDLSGRANHGYGLALLPMLLAGVAMFALGATLPAFVREGRGHRAASATAT